MAEELEGQNQENKPKVFRSMEQLMRHSFPNYCLKYPYVMRVTEKERESILFHRGVLGHEKYRRKEEHKHGD